MPHPVQQLLAQLPLIEERLGYVFKDKNLLLMAFVHRSFFNEQREHVEQHNERLEFLGDSVLGLIISDFLYARLPSEAEGSLSHLRSHIVEATSCVHFLNKLHVSHAVLLGKGERLNDGRGRESIFADLFEAIMGAIYLDGGLSVVQRFFFQHFSQDLESFLETPVHNWKAEFQDYSQKKYQKPPTYRISKQEGPEHSKVFYVVALIEEEVMGEGTGSSKKQAEQAAAHDALKRLGHG